MRVRSFGKLSDGRGAGLYILRNSSGMEAHVTDYGAALVRLYVPDRDGNMRDVVLGYDDVSGYEKGGSSFGGTVGRYANRISNASFDLNGRHYVLTANDGPNSLHGGRDFYVNRLWSPVVSFGTVSSRDIASIYAKESMNDWSDVPQSSASGVRTDDSITFVLDSPDGDQGYPGNIHIEVTYTLTHANELHIDYRAALIRDQLSEPAGKNPAATPLNLTNHSYFNLNGHDSGSVLGHIVSIDADHFTETDSRLIPTGDLLKVKWTPMDFRKPKSLGQEIDADYEPLLFGGGYDHNYVLRPFGPDESGADESDSINKENNDSGMTDIREVALMHSDDSGITMRVLTDLPGLQLYTSNGLNEEEGKGGAVYGRRSAACFETQFWPDTINKENFPGGILKAGEEFTSRTTYRFSTEGL